MHRLFHFFKEIFILVHLISHTSTRPCLEGEIRVGELCICERNSDINCQKRRYAPCPEALCCLNGGTLIRDSVCKCTKWFTGRDCSKFRCENGILTDNKCECGKDYVGEFCSQRCIYGVTNTEGVKTCNQCLGKWSGEACDQCKSPFITIEKGNNVTECGIVEAKGEKENPIEKIILWLCLGLGIALLCICAVICIIKSPESGQSFAERRDLMNTRNRGNNPMIVVDSPSRRAASPTLSDQSDHHNNTSSNFSSLSVPSHHGGQRK